MIRILLILVALILAGCATTGGAGEESEPTLIDAVPDASVEAAAAVAAGDPKQPEESKQQEGEVPLAVAESEQADGGMAEVVVQGRIRNRHEAIHDLVTEGQSLLRDVELKYVLTGKGKRQTLRGRPVAFALWSEVKQEWTVAQLELPRPPSGGNPAASHCPSAISRRVSRRGTSRAPAPSG